MATYQPIPSLNLGAASFRAKGGTPRKPRYFITHDFVVLATFLKSWRPHVPVNTFPEKIKKFSLGWLTVVEDAANLT